LQVSWPFATLATIDAALQMLKEACGKEKKGCCSDQGNL
jgi:hypothetical protein